jgi:signal transduction histidine kinase
MNSFALGKEALTRWERSTATFHRYSDADGLPPLRMANSFCEDGQGDLWIGFRDGPLVRFAQGHFQIFTASDGVGEGTIADLYLDGAGRLWAATSGGATRVDDPGSERPRFVTYTTAQGLLSNYTSQLVDDLSGNIYVGTPYGVDRLDAETGHIERYTSAELPWTAPISAYRDRHGALWFASLQALYRFTPKSEQPRPPPPILIGELRVRGVRLPVSELGEDRMSGLEFGPNQNQIQIDFFALSFRMAGDLRYQFKLEGADVDWNAPTDQRSVTYASLSPGTYHFMVRAISADGTASLTPATVSFTILRPIWQRWWFLSLAGLFLIAGAYVMHKYRVNRLLELERVRTRIATDLHDDIGASLSQIAILSEVVRQKVGRDDEAVTEPLSQITTSSSELMGTMSDIVWAIDPHKDRLTDLTQRMRRFASDVLTARDIDFDFQAPDASRNLNLGADVRRQVFLVCKESINNIVRHSVCSRVNIDFRVNRDWLTLVIRDNGQGFDTAQESDGHGLVSMRQRAKEMGGTLEITSQSGEGTTVTLKMPIDGRPGRKIQIA